MIRFSRSPVSFSFRVGRLLFYWNRQPVPPREEKLFVSVRHLNALANRADGDV